MRRQSLLSRAKTAIIFSLALGLAGVEKAHAQQEVQYSQYMFNMLAVNPAYAGSRDVLSMTGVYRQQWVGIEGAPTTQSFTIDMPVKKEKVGIGYKHTTTKLGYSIILELIYLMLTVSKYLNALRWLWVFKLVQPTWLVV
jgi:type IX secretion system PorP/SprF family membrane protein